MAQIEGDPPRPTNVEVLIENGNVDDTRDTWDKCRMIRVYDVEWHENGTCYDDL